MKMLGGRAEGGDAPRQSAPQRQDPQREAHFRCQQTGGWRVLRFLGRYPFNRPVPVSLRGGSSDDSKAELFQTIKPPFSFAPRSSTYRHQRRCAAMAAKVVGSDIRSQIEITECAGGRAIGAYACLLLRFLPRRPAGRSTCIKVGDGRLTLTNGLVAADHPDASGRTSR